MDDKNQQLADQDKPSNSTSKDLANKELQNTEANWSYNKDGASSNESVVLPETALKWTASEFIDHEKSTAWFVLFASFVAVVIAIVFLFTRSFFTAVLIATIGVLFAVMAARKPRILQYEINNRGVRIGEKFYSYETFRLFSVIREGAISSILLSPTGRFTPPISIYYPPDDEMNIKETLGNYLPYEAREAGLVEMFMFKIRF